MPRNINTQGAADAATTNEALEALRRDIDGLDQSILALIEKRVAAARGIAELKRSEGGDRLRLRPAREAVVVDRLLTQADEAPQQLVKQVWREIMACCLNLQIHTELALFAGERAAALTDAMRRRFGCAGRMSVAPSPARALQAAREREVVAVIELTPDSDWWLALQDETSLAMFECLRDDEGAVIGLAVGRIATEDLRSCPPIRIVEGIVPADAQLLAAAGSYKLVLLAEQP